MKAFGSIIPFKITDDLKYSQTFAQANDNVALQLAYDFYDWVKKENLPPVDRFPYPFDKFGGVFSKDSASELFGIGIQMQQQFSNDGDIASMVDAFKKWVEQYGGFVKEVKRSNDFFDPAKIGAGGDKMKRSKTAFCPAQTADVITFADASDPSSDNIRWVESC
ncbi:MAG: hypothetical protein Q9222_001905 [Ikaeria aurantiellina]